MVGVLWYGKRAPGIYKKIWAPQHNKATQFRPNDSPQAVEVGEFFFHRGDAGCRLNSREYGIPELVPGRLPFRWRGSTFACQRNDA